MPGKFLAFDGIDGTGKSTQVGRLAERLTALGQVVCRVSDPGGTPLGDELREILLSRKKNLTLRAEALLFMASRAELVETVVRPALSRGEIVLADRFTLANLAYQAYAGGLPVELLRSVGRLATGDLEPDRVFVLDLPVAEAQKRRGREPDRMEARTLAYHEAVRQGFLTESTLFSHIQIISAAGDVDTVEARLWSAVAEAL